MTSTEHVIAKLESAIIAYGNGPRTHIGDLLCTMCECHLGELRARLEDERPGLFTLLRGHDALALLHRLDQRTGEIMASVTNILAGEDQLLAKEDNLALLITQAIAAIRDEAAQIKTLNDEIIALQKQIADGNPVTPDQLLSIQTRLGQANDRIDAQILALQTTLTPPTPVNSGGDKPAETLASEGARDLPPAA